LHFDTLLCVDKIKLPRVNRVFNFASFDVSLLDE